MNSLSIALRSGYLSVRTAEGASEKQSSLKARLRNGLTYLLTYLVKPCAAAADWSEVLTALCCCRADVRLF